VHCLRNPHSGATVLLAFAGYAKPNTPQRRHRIDMVAETAARGCGDVIQPINESDISSDVALRLAAEFHANPSLDVILLPVQP